MNYAIVLAGGTGTRTGAELPKQYVKAKGHMMVAYSVKPLLECAQMDAVYIVCDPEWREKIASDLTGFGFETSKIKGFACPGEVRQLSVLNGMREFYSEKDASDEDTVLVHDAARPFLSRELLDECYKALPGHDGVMPALPMKDTVYLSEGGLLKETSCGKISELLDRSKVFAGQAPELFNLKKYYKANIDLLPDRILSVNGAAEPAVMAGMDIAMIPGEEGNFKVTTVADLNRFIQLMEEC